MTRDFLDTFITKDNHTPGYERFYYTKRYVASKSAAFTGKEARLMIGRALGYNVEKPNFSQRLDHQRRRYDAMDKRIPRTYLETIGVRWDEFETCLEADQELYEREAAKPRYPQYAAVRYVAGFFGKVTFPEGTPETEAIELLAQGETQRFSKMIVYPELLMVMIGAGAEPQPGYFWYPTEVKYGKRDVIFSALPRGMGRTRIL
ncbi:MAG TPA: hypothetical protein VJ932_12045 [Alkalispirochaeta sp.]|nr:hypothetical protein [Alkalispirochaeta sp.]